MKRLNAVSAFSFWPQPFFVSNRTVRGGGHDPQTCRPTVKVTRGDSQLFLLWGQGEKQVRKSFPKIDSRQQESCGMAGWQRSGLEHRLARSLCSGKGYHPLGDQALWKTVHAAHCRSPSSDLTKALATHGVSQACPH